MARFLINNTALRNNGDVALVSALRTALNDRGHSVTIATAHPGHAALNFPASDLRKEVIGYRSPFFQGRTTAHIAAIARMLSAPYRAADCILGAPGGYLNSYYGFSWKLAIYLWAKRLFRKKTAIYSQSIGPLYGRDAPALRCSANNLDLLVARDLLSFENARSAGLRDGQLLLTEDAVFLTSPRQSTASISSKIVLFSVREWPHDGRNAGQYKELVTSLSRAILSAGFDIVFASTCQGIDGYIDDSNLADEIARPLISEFGSRLSVKRGRLSLHELSTLIESVHFVIGTRLHMCLLAMLVGVPAFNISYEAKGRECYGYLGLSAYSVDYNSSPDFALGRLAQFMNLLFDIRDSLPPLMNERHHQAHVSLDKFLSKLEIT